MSEIFSYINTNTNIRISVNKESWPIKGFFRISRGRKTSAEVITVKIEQNGFIGYGESVPYSHYGENIKNISDTIKKNAHIITSKITHKNLNRILPKGAARNAVDCAIWDWLAKSNKTPVWKLINISQPKPIITSYTISLDTTENMGKKAANANHMPLLKIKLGGEQNGKNDKNRLIKIRESAPKSRLIIDANESWTENNIIELVKTCKDCRVELIEQPLPANNDDILLEFPHTIPICADESIHDRSDFTKVKDKYDAINIKLDKTGGLTEALLLKELAINNNMQVMIGCMLATSLSMAPSFLLSEHVNFIDLDGPLLLEKDRLYSMKYREGVLHPPSAKLWG